MRFVCLSGGFCKMGKNAQRRREAKKVARPVGVASVLTPLRGSRALRRKFDRVVHNAIAREMRRVQRKRVAEETDGDGSKAKASDGSDDQIPG
jgi:hypothetical protein